MVMTKSKFNNIDEYIVSLPKDTQKLLEQIRETIKKATPEALETIKYDMPTFTLNGNLIHFAAYKNHIGIYPAPSGDESFNKELSSYIGAKNSIRFPLDKPIPFDLISKIVKFRVKESLIKVKPKKV